MAVSNCENFLSLLGSTCIRNFSGYCTDSKEFVMVPCYSNIKSTVIWLSSQCFIWFREQGGFVSTVSFGVLIYVTVIVEIVIVIINIKQGVTIAG